MPFGLGLLCLLGPLCRAGFAPLPLTSGSYNQDMVVEQTAAAPVISGGYTTASMDAGLGNSAKSWYERGYNTASPTTGLPVAGSTFTHQNASDHQYRMAPSYRASNAVLLDSTLTNATFTLSTPAAFAKLSFLESGGNQGVTFTYRVHHQDGSSESGSGTIPDWFGGTSPAWTANGRLDVGSFAFNNVNNNNPRLYSLDVTLTNQASPVASLDLAYASGSGHGVIFALSGSAGAGFTPVTVTGYNADLVVEADGPHAGALSGATTAAMDDGTANTGATWYEAGYVRSANTTGLPPAGSTLTSLSASDHRYTLAPSYTANNAVLLVSNAPAVVLTPSAPVAAAALSFLAAAGNGPVGVTCVVRHANGTTETATFSVPDWFTQSPVAWVADGRVTVANKSISALNSGDPRLYSVDVPLANATSPLTNLTLAWQSGSSAAHAAIFAVSSGTPALPLAQDDFNADTEAAAAILQQWYNPSGLYDTTGWWNAANCLESL